MGQGAGTDMAVLPFDAGSKYFCTTCFKASKTSNTDTCRQTDSSSRDGIHLLPFDAKSGILLHHMLQGIKDIQHTHTGTQTHTCS